MGAGKNIPMFGAELCGNCTVLEGQIHLTNAADGSPVDEKVVYNHHILTNGPKLPFPLKIPGTSPMSGGFVGAGGDNGNTPFMYYNPAESKDVITGYKVLPKTAFTVNIVLVNKSTKPQSVKLNYELEFIPGTDSKWENVQSALIVASMLPAKNDITTSSTLKWTKSGTFIFGKGHLRKSQCHSTSTSSH